MKKITFRRLTCAAAVSGLCLSIPVAAQQSVNKELADCINQERLKLTMKGAAAGALAGLGASLLGKKGEDKKDDALKKAALGAIAGGTSGFALAHFTAFDRCSKKNPSWLPESKIERSKSYQQARTEAGYRPEEGVVTNVKAVEMPTTVSAGAMLEIRSRFVVLTPDGAEAAVEIERKLFQTVDGAESALPFPGGQKRVLTVEPGEHMDRMQVQIPAEFSPGAVFRVEFSVAAGNKPPAMASSTVTVQRGAAVASVATSQ